MTSNSRKTYIRLIIYATFILLFGNKNIPAGDYHVRCGNGTVNGIRFVNFAFVCYLNIFSHSDSSAFCITGDAQIIQKDFVRDSVIGIGAENGIV